MSGYIWSLVLRLSKQLLDATQLTQHTAEQQDQHNTITVKWAAEKLCLISCLGVGCEVAVSLRDCCCGGLVPLAVCWFGIFDHIRWLRKLVQGLQSIVYSGSRRETEVNWASVCLQLALLEWASPVLSLRGWRVWWSVSNTITIKCDEKRGVLSDQTTPKQRNNDTWVKCRVGVPLSPLG